MAIIFRQVRGTRRAWPRVSASLRKIIRLSRYQRRARPPEEGTSRGRATPATVVTGTLGDVIMDGSGDNSAGVFLRSNSTSTPWVSAQAGGADGGFRVLNPSAAAVMTARADGAVQLAPSSFFDGRSDYYGSSGSYYGMVRIPTNIVHDVTLLNPYDSTGANTQRVTFFNAHTSDEYGSPAVTKYSAYTFNYYAQQNINFDSQIQCHWGNPYHYRAYSTAESKDTFWVRAATDTDAFTNTRADMYVSGHIGIKNAVFSPWNGLRAIEGPTTAVGFGDVGDIHLASNAYFDGTWKYKASGLAANYYLYNGTHNWRVAASGAANGGISWISAMTIDPTGSVGVNMTPSSSFRLDVTGPTRVTGNLTVSGDISGAHVINATFQDLAEWVRASGELDPATVVVLDRSASNQVTPSSRAYDTTVAGVVSAHPGIVLGEAAAAKAKIATTGRVRVRVDATSAPIAIGDLLVTSDLAGMAMKSQPMELNGRKFHQPGTIIGKALEPLQSGRGEILVLLSLQ
jgi:hypothetical protein